MELTAAAMLFTRAEPLSASRNARPGIKPIRVAGSTLRVLLIDMPLMVVFALLVGTMIVRHSYRGYVGVIIKSLRRDREKDDDGFYPEFNNDFTYYNRQCDADDITTKDANDLLIHDDYTSEQAADVMMHHGAVVFKNVLSNETASDLRVYLESRHKMQRDLPWHEKFFEEQDRLALGLGAHDRPVITKALQEVGTHPVVKRSLEGILGPDPAIVEVSTMTSMHGAKDQGIHSDSDYFGSSLLYSRNFLHSYTMFMALQDTTTKMGATTLCPGTHQCANKDLRDVCLENGAFEASSNGRTGDGGALLKGDAMMFNQNIWHRGAANLDPDFPLNRVMFIITFVSRTKETPGDRRYQGLGTYYYQRFNMWGHTFQDLKDAATVMSQPLAALRAYGLWKPKGRKWGVTWIENFARELANGEHFYSSGELKEFVRFLDNIGVPKFLMGTFGRTRAKKDRKWEPFIEEMLDNVVMLLAKLNAAALGVQVLICLMVNGEGTQRRRIPAVLKRIAFTHGSVCLIGYLFVLFINQTELAKWANSGRANARPFPDAGNAQVADGSSIAPKSARLGPTTVPERDDVLVGTRFDAEFLASINRMLDYHPGDTRFNSIVDSFSNLPPALHDNSVRAILKFVQQPVAGVSPRFLMQDPTNGYWTVMSEQEAIEVTKRALVMKQSGLKNVLGRHLKSVLADSRFGALRDTILSSRFTPSFVASWEYIVFGPIAAEIELPAPSQTASDLVVRGFIVPPMRLDDGRLRAAASGARFAGHDLRRRKDSPEEEGLEVGDRIFGRFGGKKTGQWLEGKILKAYADDTVFVWYKIGHFDRISTKKIRKYDPLTESDVVYVQYNGKKGEWFKAKIAKAHPLGSYDIDYDDGEKEFFIKPQFIRKLDTSLDVPRLPSASNDTSVVGEMVDANYKGRGKWFEAYIIRENDDGTFNIYYTDETKERRVPRDRIRYKN